MCSFFFIYCLENLYKHSNAAVQTNTNKVFAKRQTIGIYTLQQNIYVKIEQIKNKLCCKNKKCIKIKWSEIIFIDMDNNYFELHGVKTYEISEIPVIIVEGQFDKLKSNFGICAIHDRYI